MFDIKTNDASNFYNTYDLLYYDIFNTNRVEAKELFIPQSEHIVPLKDGQSVASELASLSPPHVPGQSRQQLFGIKARFPGQYLVEGPAEFLISLAYAMNGLSKIYRKKGEGNRRR